MYAYAAAGISLPHNALMQYDDTVRISESELQPGDLYLLASDGLTRELSDATLAAIFESERMHPRRRTSDLADLAATLIRKANDAGGRDNITVLLLQLP